MKQKIHRWLMIILSSSLILMGCSKNTYFPKDQNLTQLAYELINQFPTSKKGLYYKTYGSNEGSLAGRLQYNVINEENRRESSIFELERYVDFDTIFTPAQKEELEGQFHNLESLILDERKLIDKHLRTSQDKTQLEIGILDAISFPVIQPAKDGTLYAFMYYAWASFDGHSGSSSFYIYNRKGEKWERFAIVFVSIT